MSWVQVILGVTLSNVALLKFFNWMRILTNLLLDYIIFFIFFMLENSQGDQRSIIISSITFSNSSFCCLK